MSHNARQSLSALMDDEGDDLELRRVLATLNRVPEDGDSWRRYHLVRSVMRREPHIDTDIDLSADIMARLESEPVPSITEPEAHQSASSVRQQPMHEHAAKPARRRTVPLARGAGIAAAVSLMVISGVQFYNGSSPLSTGSSDLAVNDATAPQRATQSSVAAPSLVDLPMFQAAPAARSNGVMTVGAGGGSMPMMLSPSQEQQSRVIDQQQALLLQSYLNRHAEGAAAGAGDSWMPLFRVSEDQASHGGMSSQP